MTRTLVFAPAAYNLAETTRMLEIARAVRRDPRAAGAVDIQFISDGGEFEQLIEDSGFTLVRMEPRMTAEDIERAYNIDRAERFERALTTEATIAKVEGELAYLREVEPVAVVTGSYLTIPLSCRVAGVPVVWVVQTTWLEPFFAHGVGLTDRVRPRLVKRAADAVILGFINLWVGYALLGSLNAAARHYGVPGFGSIFEYWRGDLTLIAEPEGFTGVEPPPRHVFVGPIVAREHFPVPPEVADLPRDRPIVYFAMGSSGKPSIVARILESFAGQPYRVVAPVRSLLDKVPDVVVPPNVVVTGWLPAREVNELADVAVIHGGIGTVLTALMAGTPFVGVPMQPEQVANLAVPVRRGVAIRVRKGRNPSKAVLAGVRRLLGDETAHARAAEIGADLAQWDGPSRAATAILDEYGDRLLPRVP